jgi:hypothetical protein
MSAEQKNSIWRVKKSSITQALIEWRLNQRAKEIQEGVEVIEHSSDHPQGWNPGFHDSRACTSHDH